MSDMQLQARAWCAGLQLILMLWSGGTMADGILKVSLYGLGCWS